MPAILFVSLILMSFSLNAAISFDPAINWKTQESQHFKYHYQEGLEALLPEVAAISERTHDRLTAFFNWDPAAKTHMVLIDSVDYVNGSAFPVPANTIRVFIPPPDELHSLSDHGGWLETLIVHEYTHILHLDKASGLPLLLRDFFGRMPVPLAVFPFPNLANPSWVMEGLATYVETDIERGIGRGQSSLFAMYMRMEVKKGIRSIREVNQGVRDWPGGTLFYLYGVHFFQFIRDSYGEDKVMQLVDEYGDNILPFFINRNARQVLGKDLLVLWQEFETYLYNRYLPTINKIEAQGIISGDRLTHHGFNTRNVQTDGEKWMYYIRSNGLQPEMLVRQHLDDGRIEELAEVNAGAYFDLHKDAGILLGQIELSENTNAYFELYLLNPESRLQTTLTHHGRYRHAVWNPGGQHIAAVHYAAGAFSLRVLDVNGQEKMRLWDAPANVVLGSLDWSPKGDYLVASVWRPDSGWNLEQFDMISRQWEVLTYQNVIEGHPHYSADGASVLFSADVNGVFNIHRLVLETREIKTVTRMLGGAFSPFEDKQFVYYLGYQREGYDIYRINRKVFLMDAYPGEKGSSQIYKQYQLGENELLQASDYRAWREMVPQWWLPVTYFSSTREMIGFSTSGYDPLLRHEYIATLTRDLKNDNTGGALTYTYDRFFPRLNGSYSRDYRRQYDQNKDLSLATKTDRFQFEAMLPLLNIKKQSALRMAVISEAERDTFRAAASDFSDTYTQYLGVAFAYNNTRRPSLNISRNYGRGLVISYTDSELTGTGKQGQVARLDWREYFSTTDAQVFAFRLLGGFGIGDTETFNLGTYGVESEIFDQTNNVYTRRQYNLRGYETGLDDLSGRRMAVGSFEYRIPVKLVQKGIMAPPLALDQISAAVFSDLGSAWDRGVLPMKLHSSVGVEFSFDTYMFYHLPLRWRIGHARTSDDPDRGITYIAIGDSF